MISLKNFCLLVFIMFIFSGIQPALAQIPAEVEKRYDDFMMEYVKINDAIKNYDEEAAVKTIRSLKPGIIKKAQALMELESTFNDFRGSEDWELTVENKPYFIKMQEYMADADFIKKNANPRIQAELLSLQDALEEIWGEDEEDYEETDMFSEEASSVAFLEISDNSTLQGRNLEIMGSAETSYAYVDDLGNLSFEIFGQSGGMEFNIGFFIEGVKTGKFEWATEGNMVIEVYGRDGDQLHGFWGNEGKGFIQVNQVGKIGEYVTGTFSGNYTDDMSEDYERLTKVSGSFNLKQVDPMAEY